MKKKIALVLLVFATAGMVVGVYFYNKPVPGLENEQAAYSLSAGSLYAAFEADENASNAKYLGQVLEVRFLSGSISLLPATTRAIRQWSYRPTLLDKRPVQAQQDVTIEFRPPQYSSKVSSQHPFHK